jgi:hypothetical protein
MELSTEQLHWLLEGIDIDAVRRLLRGSIGTLADVVMQHSGPALQNR